MMNAQNIQRPKKELSAAKVAAMEKMKQGRAEWLAEKKRCEDAGLPPPLSKSAQKKLEKIKAGQPKVEHQEEEIELVIDDNPEGEIIEEEEVEIPLKRHATKKAPKKQKQVVVNNYYEEVVSEEEESSSEEEEEIINNHFRRYTNNPNPQYVIANSQKSIRFV